MINADQKLEIIQELQAKDIQKSQSEKNQNKEQQTRVKVNL